MITTATVCSGIGSPEQALKNLKVPHKIVFACDNNPYAKATYQANHQAETFLEDMTAEQWDEPAQYSDLFIGGIPCQAFSLAGKRLGELDPRGLLFFDFHRYVKKRQPKVFIIENVKGLLSDAGGKTFSNWLQLLGRSVNKQENLFNHPDSLGYNLHYTVLNSKKFGVPQNRERVFIAGIRSDLPNTFHFPTGEPLTIRLKDILEPWVDEKYYLSRKMLNGFLNKPGDFGERFNPKKPEEIANCVTARYYKMAITDNYIQEPVNVANTIARVEPQLTMLAQLAGFESTGRIYDVDGLSCTIKANGGGGGAKTGWYALEDTEQGYLMLNDVLCRIRRLTPLECARLQAFPDSFIWPVSDTQRYKQCGNTITVTVMQAIIKNLLQILC